MILAACVATLCGRVCAGSSQAAPSPAGSGLTRTLDKRARSWAIHLEVDDGRMDQISDYTLELAPEQPKKDKKTKEEEKPKPGSYVLRLMNLRWKAGNLTHRQDVFGSGTLEFAAEGFPSEFLGAKDWILAPLLGFYVPPSGGDGSISDIVVGDGWKLAGKSTSAAATGKGQPVAIAATLKRADGQVLQLDGDALLDLKTGWPLECSGTIEGSAATVTYSCKLRR